MLFLYVSSTFLFSFKASSAEKVLAKCAPEETEMSINAKFRAIQPTPSILSYVEDNVRMIASYQPSHMLWLYVKQTLTAACSY